MRKSNLNTNLLNIQFFLYTDGTCPSNSPPANFPNLEAGRPPMNCTCVGGNVKDIIQASSHDVNRRPYTGKPGSTYKAPNGDSRTYGRMALLNTIMTMMTTEGLINIRMIPMVVIITIGKTVLEVRHTASGWSLLQELHW